MSILTDQRMDELESRLAFQEDIIENLNQVVARQDGEMLALKRQLAELAERIKEFDDVAVVAGAAAGVEIPPHY